MKPCWNVHTLVVTKAHTLSASGGRLLLKASKYRIKHWHSSKWILYTRRTNVIDIKWYGVEAPRVLYHYAFYAYSDYLYWLISTAISSFQLTSGGRSWHYMEVIGLPSVSGINKRCRDRCYFHVICDDCTISALF